jgi:hypothetical protein
MPAAALRPTDCTASSCHRLLPSLGGGPPARLSYEAEMRLPRSEMAEMERRLHEYALQFISTREDEAAVEDRWRIQLNKSITSKINGLEAKIRHVIGAVVSPLATQMDDLTALVDELGSAQDPAWRRRSAAKARQPRRDEDEHEDERLQANLSRAQHLSVAAFAGRRAQQTHLLSRARAEAPMADAPVRAVGGVRITKSLKAATTEGSTPKAVTPSVAPSGMEGTRVRPEP